MKADESSSSLFAEPSTQLRRRRTQIEASENRCVTAVVHRLFMSKSPKLCVLWSSNQIRSLRARRQNAAGSSEA